MVHGDTIKEKDKVILSEYDQSSKTSLFIKLEDKIKKYVKIIGGTGNCINKGNCDEMKFILDQAKIFRDAIVHAKPVSYYEADFPGKVSKEYVFFNITFEHAQKIFDNVIALIKIIEKIISGSTEKLWWIDKRNDDGIFPDTIYGL